MQQLRKKSKSTQQQQLSSLRLLVVLPDSSGTQFKIPMPGSEDFFFGPKFNHFTTLNSGGNCTDRLKTILPHEFSSEHNNNNSLFSWTRDPTNPEQLECILDGCHAAWGFTVACLLQGQLHRRLEHLKQLSQKQIFQDIPQIEPQSLGFTMAATFKKAALSAESSKNAAIIGGHYDLVLLCCPLQFRTYENLFDNQKDVENVLRWCAFDLMIHQVKIYPPLSLTSFIVFKVNRNTVLQEYRLPTIEISIEDSWSVTLTKISNIFAEQGYNYDPTIGFVGKPLVGACGLGVIRIVQDGTTTRAWTIIDSIELTIGEDIQSGTSISVEPFVKELISEEFRVFYHPYNRSALSELFTCQTSLNERGEVTSAVNTFSTFVSHSATKVNKLANLKQNIYSKLSQSFSPAMLKDICFRFDLFFKPDESGKKEKAYLNEVDIFPLADPFLTEGELQIMYLLSLAKATYSYIQEHIDCWPA